MSESSAPPFQQEKHHACTGELHWSACTPARIPANCFLPLHRNHVVISITQILSLWHIYVYCRMELDRCSAKNLHLLTLPLCPYLTVQISNCSLFELLCVFNTTLLNFVAYNCSIVNLGNNLWNILNGIKLPPALGSTLYVMCVCLDSNLVNITDVPLSGLIFFTLTTSKLLSCSSGLSICRSSFQSISCIIFCPQSCCCINLHTTLKWFCFLHTLHFLPESRCCTGVDLYHSIYNCPPSWLP